MPYAEEYFNYLEKRHPSCPSSALPWPRLEDLVLPEKGVQDRRSCIGGSDSNTILSGDHERIIQLCRVKRGEAEPEQLCTILPVMLGCWTEAFNRHWYGRYRTNVWDYPGVNGFRQGRVRIWAAIRL